MCYINSTSIRFGQVKFFLPSMPYGDFPPDVSNFLLTVRHTTSAHDCNSLNLQEMQNFRPSLALRLHPHLADAIVTGGQRHDRKEKLAHYGGSMNFKSFVITALALALAVPLSAGPKKKKVQTLGMLEKMEAVPCGAKQRGLTGLGSI